MAGRRVDDGGADCEAEREQDGEKQRAADGALSAPPGVTHQGGVSAGLFEGRTLVVCEAILNKLKRRRRRRTRVKTEEGAERRAADERSARSAQRGRPTRAESERPQARGSSRVLKAPAGTSFSLQTRPATGKSLSDDRMLLMLPFLSWHGRQEVAASGVVDAFPAGFDSSLQARRRASRTHHLVVVPPPRPLPLTFPTSHDVCRRALVRPCHARPAHQPASHLRRRLYDAGG